MIKEFEVLRLAFSSTIAVAASLAVPAGANAMDSGGSPRPEQTGAQPSEPGAAPADDALRVDDGKQADALFDLSLEEILAQEVTSVAKKSRRVGDSDAAVTVITQNDIRNSSARTVPDLLRMVPGMEVAEVQSSAASVSARGFTSRFAANLLVMVDGAAIYSTSISGMFWDQALIPLQDIERIEVIRGPGGTLWGSNSINGIVNIITKQAVDTQGLRMNVSVGTFDTRTEVGIGSQISNTLSLRLYGDYRKTIGLDTATGHVAGNDWQGGLGGVRLDYAPSVDDSIVVLAEYSQGAFNERFKKASFNPLAPGVTIEPQHNRFHARHMLARWKRVVGPDLDFSVQAYFNNLFRTEFGATIDRDLYDLSMEGRWKIDSTNELNMGIAGRISGDRIGNNFSLSHPTGRNTDRWLTAYLQNDFTIIPDTLRITIGSKFELNSFTGYEIQPSARIFYRPSPALAVWAAASRAVKTPLLISREMLTRVTMIRSVANFPNPIPVTASFSGSLDAEAEVVNSYEAGIRGTIAKGWSYDVSGFYSRYSRLATRNFVSSDPIFVPPFQFPVGLGVNYVVGNEASGRTVGIEAVVDGQLASWWKVEASVSALDLDLTSLPGTNPLVAANYSPRYQLRLKSDLNLSQNATINGLVHHVASAQHGNRPAYTDLDIRATYRLSPQFELSLVGSNLLDRRRLEYFQDQLPLESAYVPRMAYVEARLRF